MTAHKSILTFFIFCMIIINNYLFSQNWEKSFSKTKIKIKNKIKKEVEPLSIDFKIIKINYNPLKNPNSLNLDLSFYGYNPNPIGISLSRIEFDLYVNEKHTSKFYNDKKIKIPKNGDFKFVENAEINIIEAGKTLFYKIIKRKVNYKITGTYFLKTSIGTFPLKTNLMEKNIN